jgi:hypothetical protein
LRARAARYARRLRLLRQPAAGSSYSGACSGSVTAQS